MAIVKLKPAFKDYIWGGKKLVEEYGKDFQGARLAESWELSCHPDGESVIANGDYAGKTLSAYILEKGSGILGRNCRRFSDFPILIKLIDAHDNLSVQVHPDNGYALRNEGQYGKTEMWYIVDCDPGAFLYYGFSRPVSEAEFRRRIADNTLLEVLNRVDVQKGDVLFIESGTIHAIGKGIVIAEIQQNSNITYRVYDYGRVGADGKPRALHIEEAVRVTNRHPVYRGKSSMPHIAQCDYFTVDKLHLDGGMMKCVSGQVTDRSFVSVLVLDGEGLIRCGQEELRFQKGDTFFLDADSGDYQIEGVCEALITSIGEKASPIRIAIDMSSKHVQIGLFDVHQNCIARTELDMDMHLAPEAMVEQIGKRVLMLLEEQDIPIDHCIGIGAGVPGTVDVADGRMVYSNNIRWSNVPFAEVIRRILPLPVYMQNNANCMALGEYISGTGKGYRNVVYLNIGNGVGSAVVCNGEFLESTIPGGGELGHMVVRVGGKPCSCGRQGCLEAYISQKAFQQQSVEAMREHPETVLWELCGGDLTQLDVAMVFQAAWQGDRVGSGLVGRYVRYLGEGIINIVNIFRPDLIVLGGMVAGQGEALLGEIRRYIRDDCFGGESVALPIIAAATLGNDAGLIGAANLI